MNLDYNQNIPGSQNNPSDDQPLMRTNTNSIRDWVQIDHYGFKNSQNLGGLHKQVRAVNLLAIPANLTSQMGTIYTKLATSTGILTESNIFFTPGTSGNEYQLTRAVTASFTNLFGGLVQNYLAQGADYFGGWSFLPGGLLFQYGRVVHASGGSFTVKFPVQFSDLTSIIITLQAVADSGSSRAVNVRNGFTTSTQFEIVCDTSSGLKSINWYALGK